MTRIVIAGGPRTGKSTYALDLGLKLWREHGSTEAEGEVTGRIRHTDDLINLGWSEASAAAVEWFREPGPWIVEGVAVPRALRKWLAANEGKPCDVLHWLVEPHEELTPGQAAMAKGCATVFEEIRAELEARGVRIVEGMADSVRVR